MSNFENKIIIIIKKKRQSKSSNTINLYIYLSVLKLLSKIDQAGTFRARGGMSSVFQTIFICL